MSCESLKEELADEVAIALYGLQKPISTSEVFSLHPKIRELTNDLLKKYGIKDYNGVLTRAKVITQYSGLWSLTKTGEERAKKLTAQNSKLPPSSSPVALSTSSSNVKDSTVKELVAPLSPNLNVLATVVLLDLIKLGPRNLQAIRKGNVTVRALLSVVKEEENMKSHEFMFLLVKQGLVQFPERGTNGLLVITPKGQQFAESNKAEAEETVQGTSWKGVVVADGESNQGLQEEMSDEGEDSEDCSISPTTQPGTKIAIKATLVNEEEHKRQLLIVFPWLTEEKHRKEVIAFEQEILQYLRTVKVNPTKKQLKAAFRRRVMDTKETVGISFPKLLTLMERSNLIEVNAKIVSLPSKKSTAVADKASIVPPAINFSFSNEAQQQPSLLPLLSQPSQPVSSIIQYSQAGKSHSYISEQTLLQKPIESPYLSIDLEGFHDDYQYALAQICFDVNEAFLLDHYTGRDAIHETLQRFLAQAPNLRYVFLYDCHHDVVRLGKSFVNGLTRSNQSFIDLQLVYEYFTGEITGGMQIYLNWIFGEDNDEGRHENKFAMKRLMKEIGSTFWQRRPIDAEQIYYAASDVILLQRSLPILMGRIRKQSEIEGIDLMEMFVIATMKRIDYSFHYSPEQRFLLFDSYSFAPISHELVEAYHETIQRYPNWQRSLFFDPLGLPYNFEAVYQNYHHHYMQCICSSRNLLQLLPPHYQERLPETFVNEQVLDIVLDKGRRPTALLLTGERKDVFEEKPLLLVKDEELKFICNQIDSPFGQDNRVGIEGELHRISCIRNKQENIIGLTIRIGRYFLGNTYLISDLLFHPDNRHKSILVVGPPGSGKTSLIREIARQLAEKHNVMIVDTSNEISGDSDVPHSCVGRARRMMVRDIEEQAQVMIECVQNHTPDIMIIDEIGRPKEVKAAKTCKERGVRLIASAHGDFRKLLKNSELNGLLGGVEVVTLGDESAKKLNHGNKLSAVRAGAPTFDIVVQVEKGQFHLFKVIKDTGHAVDKILAGEKGKAELRERKLEFIHRPFPTQEDDGEEEEDSVASDWERDWDENISNPPPPHSPHLPALPAEKDRSVNIPSLQQAKSQLLSFSFIEI